MNKNDAVLFLPLIQAFADGKTIQHRYNEGGRWYDATTYLACDRPIEYYRIKPEPVVIKSYRALYPRGSMGAMCATERLAKNTAARGVTHIICTTLTDGVLDVTWMPFTKKEN